VVEVEVEVEEVEFSFFSSLFSLSSFFLLRSEHPKRALFLSFASTLPPGLQAPPLKMEAAAAAVELKAGESWADDEVEEGKSV